MLARGISPLADIKLPFLMELVSFELICRLKADFVLHNPSFAVKTIIPQKKGEESNLTVIRSLNQYGNHYSLLSTISNT